MSNVLLADGIKMRRIHMVQVIEAVIIPFCTNKICIFSCQQTISDRVNPGTYDTGTVTEFTEVIRLFGRFEIFSIQYRTSILNRRHLDNIVTNDISGVDVTIIKRPLFYTGTMEKNCVHKQKSKIKSRNCSPPASN